VSASTRNTQLSDMFHKLAKMHQECSLEPSDEFRALTNNLISGRLRQLNFEITPHNLDRVKNIKGIGQSSADKMAEFFKRGDGKCNKMEKFEKDEQRMAMRAMKNIWGVGKVKVNKSHDPLRIFGLFHSHFILSSLIVG